MQYVLVLWAGLSVYQYYQNWCLQSQTKTGIDKLRDIAKEALSTLSNSTLNKVQKLEKFKFLLRNTRLMPDGNIDTLMLKSKLEASLLQSIDILQ